MKFKILIASIAFGFVAGSAFAELGDVRKVPAASKKRVSFKKDLKPAMDASCLKCHSGDRPKSKYVMDTVANIIKGGSSDEAAIIPGNAKKSPIVHYCLDLVEDLEMPPTSKREKYPKLTAAQIADLIAWIDQGAKDN